MPGLCIRLTTSHADQVADEERYHYQIDRDGETSLVPEVPPAMGENEANENQLAQAGYGQDEWAVRWMERSVDQHRSDERDQRAPIKYNDLCDWTFQGLSEGGE